MMFGLRLLWRDWRGGELGILAAAIITAVAIVTGISLFTERLQQGINAQSTHFLAADRVLTSSRPVDEEWLAYATGLGLEQARVMRFQSVVYAGADADAAMQLVSINAVSDAYPLRGEVELSDRPFVAGVKSQEAPAAGSVWVDSRLLPMLDLSIGDTLYVGEAPLIIRKVIVSEPDGGSSMFSFGPRLMMNLADIDATRIVQPGSRVSYRYLFAGDLTRLNQYGDWLQKKMQPSHKWLELKDSQPRIGRSLERAEKFLLLAGSLGVGLAGIAIALAARRYSERHYDYVAMMKSLGASSNRVLFIYISNLLVLGVAALLVGCVVGWGIQELFIGLLQEYLQITTVPLVTLKPFLVGSVTALVCLLVFAVPPLLGLQGVSPLRVLRRDLPQHSLSNMLSYGLGVAGIAALMFWYSGNFILTVAVLGGVLLTCCIVGVIAWYVLRGTANVGMQAGSSWRLALASMRRRGVANAVQIVIFSLAIMLLLMLGLVRTSLIEEWQLQLPDGTPNHYLLNVAADEVTKVEQLLDEQNLPREVAYPLIRGRLTAVNAFDINERVAQTDPTLAHSIDRELNLTWADAIPADNILLQGQWWQQGGEAAAEVSIESRLAERLQLKVGDSLTFTIGSQLLHVRLSSIRQLDWETMKPNFYMVFPPALLKQYPATYMTSFYLPAEKKHFLNAFLRQFPTITVIEMDAVIKQIRTIVEQVSGAIELVLGLIVVSGLLVLVASVQASLDSRFQESAILRTLGAKRGLVLGSLAIEFSLLGFMAGLLAAFSAELVVYVLQEFVLEMNYIAHPWVWLVGPVLGAILIGSAGYITCRKVVNTPPIQVLRDL